MNAAETLRTLDQYALVILPALLVAEQFGIPLPAVPALLGFGALAAHGRGGIPLMLSTMAAVALIVDFAWYESGRRRGAQVLRGLCRLSPEPDFCVRRVEKAFARYGACGMLVSKFVPGLTTILPLLAGVFAVGRVRFAVYELAGVLLWAGTWIGVGYAFSEELAVIAARVARLGHWLVVVVAALLGAYIAGTYLRRRLYLRRLRMATISPEALKGGLEAGVDVTIVDLRTPREASPMRAAGHPDNDPATTARSPARRQGSPVLRRARAGSSGRVGGGRRRGTGAGEAGGPGGIIEPRFSPDQHRQINHFPPTEV
jgi:membrane protein DedA with SNARE-associated domain